MVEPKWQPTISIPMYYNNKKTMMIIFYNNYINIQEDSVYTNCIGKW